VKNLGRHVLWVAFAVVLLVALTLAFVFSGAR
jgi:hypothetical protein